MNDKWYNSKFAINVGEGLAIFLLCLGIGTCSMLCYNTKIETKPDKTLNHNVEHE